MFRFVKSAIAVAGIAVFVVGTTISGASASGIVKLGPPAKNKLDSLGVAPEKEEIVLNLGALRTGEAKLPPGPLTLAERNQLRIRAAVQIQDAVSRARRDRLANRNAPAPKPEAPTPSVNDDDDRPEDEEDDVADEDEFTEDEDVAEDDDPASDQAEEDVVVEDDSDDSTDSDDNSDSDSGGNENASSTDPDSSESSIIADARARAANPTSGSKVGIGDDYQPARVEPGEADEVVKPRFN